METLRLPYKNDSFGNPLFTEVSFSTSSNTTPKPIALFYHGGGFIIGSASILPRPQLIWLIEHNFVVVGVNYRLAPQVPATTCVADALKAHTWATQFLPDLLAAHSTPVTVDASRVVAFGHSAGGSLSILIAAAKPDAVRAVTAFYPGLYLADSDSTGHQPYLKPPFGIMPDHVAEEEWSEIKPAGVEISEFPFARPGAPLAPRNRWQVGLMKTGTWSRALCPDGDYTVVDPMAKITGKIPPVMFVQGGTDDVPGSGLQLVERASQQLKNHGTEVETIVVPGVGHMFDLPPTVGTSDLDVKWESVVKGLQWLERHVAA